MKAWLFAFVLGLACFSSIAQAEIPVGLGSWCEITLMKDSRLGQVWTEGDTVTHATVKIIKHGTGDWYQVEYESFKYPDKNGQTDTDGTVQIQRRLIWVNFAQVFTINPTSEPTHDGLKQGYKGGVKVLEP